MCTESKVQINKFTVRPILTYAAESGAETSKTKSILRSTEIRAFEKILVFRT